MEARHASPEIDGPKLRELRKEAGLSVTALARRIEVDPSYVSAIERGRRPTVAPATFNRICQALDVQDRTKLLRPEAQPRRVA